MGFRFEGSTPGHRVGSLYQAHFRVWKLEAVTERFLEASVNLPEASVNLPEASVNLPEASVNLPEASVNLPMYTNTVFWDIRRFTEASRKIHGSFRKIHGSFRKIPRTFREFLEESFQLPSLNCLPWGGCTEVPWADASTQ